MMALREENNIFRVQLSDLMTNNNDNHLSFVIFYIISAITLTCIVNNILCVSTKCMVMGNRVETKMQLITYIELNRTTRESRV